MTRPHTHLWEPDAMGWHCMIRGCDVATSDPDDPSKITYPRNSRCSSRCPGIRAYQDGRCVICNRQRSEP